MKNGGDAASKPKLWAIQQGSGLAILVPQWPCPRASGHMVLLPNDPGDRIPDNGTLFSCTKWQTHGKTHPDPRLAHPLLLVETSSKFTLMIS